MIEILIYLPAKTKQRDVITCIITVTVWRLPGLCAGDSDHRCRKRFLFLSRFYRAMHFSAKRGIAIACRLSVCLSVCNVGEL